MLTHSQSASAPARFVVLGARGFVAREIVAEAERLGWSGATRAIGSSEIDLTAPASVDALVGALSPDATVVFVSALTPDRGRDIATLMRNLAMAQHLCAALEKQPCAHLVNIGSDAVYDDNANPVRETSCASPASFHGVMHFTREQMLLETTKRLKIPLVRLRPSLLYGPGDTHNGYGPNRFVRTGLADGRITLFGNGEEQRDHVYIGDVARLVLEIVARRSIGVLNIATGTSVSFHDVATLVSELAGRSVAIDPTPRANPITYRHFDSTALVTALPQFAFTPMREGLARMVASERQ